jgi:hypothetical protein
MAAGVLYLMKRKSEALDVPNPAFDLGRFEELIFRYVP